MTKYKSIRFKQLYLESGPMKSARLHMALREAVLLCAMYLICGMGLLAYSCIRNRSLLAMLPQHFKLETLGNVLLLFVAVFVSGIVTSNYGLCIMRSAFVVLPQNGWNRYAGIYWMRCGQCATIICAIGSVAITNYAGFISLSVSVLWITIHFIPVFLFPVTCYRLPFEEVQLIRHGRLMAEIILKNSESILIHVDFFPSFEELSKNGFIGAITTESVALQ